MMDLVSHLDELAALLEVEASVRAALLGWHAAIEGRDAPVFRSIARRIELGAPTDIVLTPLVAAAGPDARALLDVVRSHDSAGASLATSVRCIARSIEARRALAHEGRAAGAAAKLSGRMLGLFAGASIILAPMARGLSPAAAIATAGSAGILAWAGVRWMRHLSPRPPSCDDPVAATAEAVAELVRAGLHPHAALDLVARTSIDLDRARRRVALGMTWPDALTAPGERGSVRLAQVLRRGDRLGVPMADALTALAAGIRERRRREFEIRTRRAPVLLVAPVTLCLLPAFAIVVIVPMMRGLSL